MNLLPMTLLAMSWLGGGDALAGEPAPVPAVNASPLEALKQRSPEARWAELKAKNLPAKPAAPAAASAPAAVPPVPPVDPAFEEAAAKPIQVSAIPENLNRPLPEAELLPVPPSPESVDEPTPSLADDSVLPTPIGPSAGERSWIVPNQPIPEVTSEGDAQGTTPVPPGYTTRLPWQVAQAEPISPERVTPADPLPQRNIPPNSLRQQGGLRSIREIKPFYNRETDNDIREFAVEKAAEYNVTTLQGIAGERMFPSVAYHWEAANLVYPPLYFEDPALERYGHTYGDSIQPYISAARFCVQLVGLPYQMTIHPPHCLTSQLGYYRPGECAPKLHYQIPLNAEAAAVQGAVVTGLIFAIP